MRVIYTSKGLSKKFGVRVIYRKIRYSNIEFHENPSSGSRQIHDEANTRFWQFCESASASGCELSNRCQRIRIVFVTTLACFKDGLPHSGSDDEAKPWLEQQDFV